MNDENDLYAIDEKTGKRYKKLKGMNPEGIKMAKGLKGAGLTMDQLRSVTEEDPDIAGFDIEEMDNSAETFLAHLRVPPTPKEMAQLRAEKKRQLDEKAKTYRQEQTELSKKSNSSSESEDDSEK